MKRRSISPNGKTCDLSKKLKKKPDKRSSTGTKTEGGKKSKFSTSYSSEKGSNISSGTCEINEKNKHKRKKKVHCLSVSENVDSLDISQLLHLGEGRSFETQEETITNNSNCGGSSESDEGDWEEVKGEGVKSKDPVIPKEGVNITLELPAVNSFKRKKKEFDVEAHIKKQMNQVKRELQLLMHKVHVLGWIAHLKYVNTILNSETIMAMSLSLINNKNLYPPKHADLGYLERVLKWFHSVIELKEHLKNPVATKGLIEQLCHQYSEKVAYSKRHFLFMFIVTSRTLGLKTRLIMSFQVVPVRPKNIELSGKKNQEVSEKSMSQIPETQNIKVEKELCEGEVKIEKIENSCYFKKEETQEALNKNSSKRNRIRLSVNNREESSNKVAKSVKGDNNKERTKNVGKGSGKSTKKVLTKSSKLRENKDDNEGLTSKFFPSPSEINKRSKIFGEKNVLVENTTDSSSEDEFLGNVSRAISSHHGKESQITETPKPKLNKIAVKRAKEKQESVKVTGKKRGNKYKTNPKVTPDMKNKVIEKATMSSDTDSDFVPKSVKKNMNQDESDRKVFSSDEEHQSKRKQGVDVWTEVFLEAEEKWISVDVARQKIHCVNELYSRATQPVVYVIACNNDSTLKDVTKRYVPNWHSDTRKKRVDETWWNETMWPYLGPKTAQEREEDEDINKQLLDKPLPSSISEYKDHPLYALQRHLLKFEAIYPPDAPTLGFVRGEPVFPRECVVTLRSREVWFKEARVVRLRETPYKIVKSRPKYDKMTGEFKKDLPLEVFGFWQTEEYIPPIAVDGKVPRNEYGNVDLFKPCMLPKGTVHLQIPAINKVARKLGIDCAAAVTGFEFHSGASHPITDGYVVCEEFKDVLLDAWNKEMDETNKKNEEKRLKRIYDNWKRLIRGLLIREKLKIKYDFGRDENRANSSKSETGNKRATKKKKQI